MLRFRQMKSLQKFAVVRANVYIHFNQERHLVSRGEYVAVTALAVAVESYWPVMSQLMQLGIRMVISSATEGTRNCKSVSRVAEYPESLQIF